MEKAAEKLCPLLGYTRKTAAVTNSRHKVNVLFLKKEGSLDLKLIEPSDADSPLWDFVKKGGGLHHLCFKADDVEQACADLEGKGVRILSAPTPGEAFDDNLIAFCYLGFGLNAEVIDTEARRGLLKDIG